MRNKRWNPALRHTVSGEPGSDRSIEPPPRSFKVEVIADSSGEWTGNAIRLATWEEAERYGANLAARWTAVCDWHVVRSDDPVNYKADAHGNLERV